MGRSPSPPPHPHPTLVPPLQMKCEPGWPSTPERPPFFFPPCQIRAPLGGTKNPCLSSARLRTTSGARLSAVHWLSAPGLWLGSWLGPLWTVFSGAQLCPPDRSVSFASLPGFLALPSLQPRPGRPVWGHRLGWTR